jgi:hypothetical protein
MAQGVMASVFGFYPLMEGCPIGKTKIVWFPDSYQEPAKESPLPGRRGLQKTRGIRSWPTPPGRETKKNKGGNMMLLLGNTAALAYLFAI